MKQYIVGMSKLDEFKLIQEKAFIDKEEMYDVLLAIAESRVKAIIRNKDKLLDPLPFENQLQTNSGD